MCQCIRFDKRYMNSFSWFIDHRFLESAKPARFYLGDLRAWMITQKGKTKERGSTQRIRHNENGRFCKRRFIASVRGRRDVRRYITIIHFVNSAHLYNGFRVRIKSEQLYSFGVAWRESKCLLTPPARERVLIIFCEASAHYSALRVHML